MATARVEPLEKMEDLGKGVILPREIMEEWLERWDWTWHQLARKEFPRGFSSLQDFQLACLISDPVYWVQAFLREPEDPDHRDPYSVWDYQKEALRYRGHKIYYCAAEVGKTRDIVADGMYMAYTTRNGSGLIGAPQQTHLDEIIDGMTDQMRWNPVLEQFLRRHKKHPHHAFYLINEFKLDFRPSGHDGEAFRGVHARTFAKLDEAAKMDHEKQWSEFWRAIKPGCIVSVSSVPDGRRDTNFYKLGQRAKSAGKNEEVTIDGLKDAGSHVKAIDWKHIHWSKRLMPPPFWTPERRRFFIEQFGGEDTPGYQHNVEGLDGDPEYSVFPWHQLKYCFKDIPEYRALKVMVNVGRGEVLVEGYRCEYVPGDDGPVPRKVLLMDTAFPLSTFFDYGREGEDTEFRRLLRSFFTDVPGLKLSGADFGYSQDPTEIVVKLKRGRVERLIARLQLRGVTYDQQCQAIDALDDVFGPREEHLWGTDLGNAGSAVVHMLRGEPRYRHKNYEGRLRGFMFEATAENVNEDGEPIIEARTGKPAKITMKELATDIMTSKMQRQEWEIPPDPEISQVLTNHTVSSGSKHRIFSKDNDHFIDAWRVSELAWILGQAVEDVFVSGN